MEGTWMGKGGSMALCVAQRTENMDRKQVTGKDYDRTGMKTSSPEPIVINGFRTKLET
jgi:hypothetical protein